MEFSLENRDGSLRLDLTDTAERDLVALHRNLLFGLWVADRLGRRKGDAEAYAWSVHFADLAAPGHDDLLGKVMADLTARGLGVRPEVLRERLSDMAASAFLQVVVRNGPNVVASNV